MQLLFLWRRERDSKNQIRSAGGRSGTGAHTGATFIFAAGENANESLSQGSRTRNDLFRGSGGTQIAALQLLFLWRRERDSKIQIRSAGGRSGTGAHTGATFIFAEGENANESLSQGSRTRYGLFRGSGGTQIAALQLLFLWRRERDSKIQIRSAGGRSGTGAHTGATFIFAEGENANESLSQGSRTRYGLFRGSDGTQIAALQLLFLWRRERDTKNQIRSAGGRSGTGAHTGATFIFAAGENANESLSQDSRS